MHSLKTFTDVLAVGKNGAAQDKELKHPPPAATPVSSQLTGATATPPPTTHTAPPMGAAVAIQAKPTGGDAHNTHHINMRIHTHIHAHSRRHSQTHAQQQTGSLPLARRRSAISNARPRSLHRRALMVCANHLQAPSCTPTDTHACSRTVDIRLWSDNTIKAWHCTNSSAATYAFCLLRCDFC